MPSDQRRRVGPWRRVVHVAEFGAPGRTARCLSNLGRPRSAQKVPVMVEVTPPDVLATDHVSPLVGWAVPVPEYWA